MSSVYRAQDTLMDRPVVLKILKDAAQDLDRQRFLLEARIAGNLNHDNVIRTYDFGFDDENRPFMVLEYLNGEDLEHAIKGQRTGNLNRKAQIAWELAGALEYIHPQGIIHRDLKPANVFLSDGKVKLMDFGIARVQNVSLTRAGTIMGTPRYMAPEQVSTGQVSSLADVYAFGVVLYELFTGTPAYGGDNIAQVFYAVMHSPLDPGPLVHAGVPAPLVQMILQCTAKDPALRPPNLSAIQEELGRFIDSTGGIESRIPTLMTRARLSTAAMPVAQPVEPKKSGFTLWLAIVAALATILVVGGLWYLLRGETLPLRIQTTTGEMMLVPEGAFLAGPNRESVKLPAYYVDRTEVTNRAYAEYTKAAGAKLPATFAADKPEYPVVDITFDEAAAFAKWAGKRLPTSMEWEKAARGVDGRKFPWGDNVEPRAHVGEGTAGSTGPAAGFPQGESPFHALQMVGNVWEWVDERSTPSQTVVEQFGRNLSPPPAAGETWKMIRGGSFVEPLDQEVLTGSYSTPARFHKMIIGFRCVKAPPK